MASALLSVPLVGKKVPEILKFDDFTPVHCSSLNQIEQWFSILERKRFRIADVESTDDLDAKIAYFIAQWNSDPGSEWIRSFNTSSFFRKRGR